ncbi:MAG: amidase [Actinomycetota bacterium]|nr:amidase [Actinomycetota bacterium]
MADESLLFRPATELARLVAAREVSPVELIEAALARAEEVNADLNCFAFVHHDAARRTAADLEQAIVSDAPLGPLAGVPVALKDTTPTAGDRTTLGSRTHMNWVPERDGYVAAKLRAAGAVIIGKTTTPEFAHTLVTDSPLWGPTRNPWDPTRTPGGSSGGSAVAVATGCVALAEGSDMGGSVRIPAAWCGVVGLKPGLGRIPMDVLLGLFDTISHHGPLARTVDDARLFLACTQGPDDADILSVPGPLDLDEPVVASVEGMRLALSAHRISAGVIWSRRVQLGRPA